MTTCAVNEPTPTATWAVAPARSEDAVASVLTAMLNVTVCTPCDRPGTSKLKECALVVLSISWIASGSVQVVTPATVVQMFPRLVVSVCWRRS